MRSCRTSLYKISCFSLIYKCIYCMQRKTFQIMFITPFSWSIYKLLIQVSWGLLAFFFFFLNHSDVHIPQITELVLLTITPKKQIFSLACPFQEIAGHSAGNRCADFITVSLETKSLRFVEVHCIAIFLQTFKALNKLLIILFNVYSCF